MQFATKGRVQGGLPHVVVPSWRDGRLFATWKDGQARHPGYLDDYTTLALMNSNVIGNNWSSNVQRYA